MVIFNTIVPRWPKLYQGTYAWLRSDCLVQVRLDICIFDPLVVNDDAIVRKQCARQDDAGGRAGLVYLL